VSEGDTTRSPTCRHCGEGLGSYGDPEFCCNGCRAAFALLQDRGLERFYALRGGRAGRRIGDGNGPPATRPWLEALVDGVPADGDGQVVLDLDVEGIHCGGCVWTIKTLFDRCNGAGVCEVNPGSGRITVSANREHFPFEQWLDDLDTLGYRSGPVGTATDEGVNRALRGLLVRFGVSAAIALNSMVLALSHYLGMEATDPLAGVFGWVNLALGTLAVIIGGPVFIRPAWAALKHGVLHLDLPISVGIVAAWLGSVVLMLTVGPDAAYFDTLTIFVALMLLGRYLQERMVARNRALVRGDAGVSALLTRRIGADGTITLDSIANITPGDQLLVAPGELVGVASRALHGEAAVSLAWIDGESEPHAVCQDDRVPAGAHVVGERALRLEAAESFDSSRLERLLRTTVDTDGGPRTGFWHWVSTIYVVAVLGFAAIGFGLWLAASATDAIQVAVAVLVVTCPCAIGLASPLAEEFGLAKLRRAGMFTRRKRVLDRLVEVTDVVFDKTGTLTDGKLELADTAAVDALAPTTRQQLFQLVARSNHPKSRAIFEHLQARWTDLRLDEAATVSETAGRGMTDGRFSLTRADHDPTAVALKDGHEDLLQLTFREPLKRDAAEQVRALEAAGLKVWILSGDAQSKVDDAAAALGVAPERALGQLAPEDKAARIHHIGAETVLMLGDGINDAPAFETAGLAGTPATDRPQLPARSDFYMLTSGVGPVASAIATAHRVRTVIRRNLWFAVIYNAAGIAAALAGLLSPLACAIFMPASSLTVLALTVAGSRFDTRSKKPSVMPPSLTATGALA